MHYNAVINEEAFFMRLFFRRLPALGGLQLFALLCAQMTGTDSGPAATLTVTNTDRGPSAIGTFDGEKR